MNMPAQFAGFAQNISARFGGPYHASRITDKGNPVYDDGGSIVTPGTPSTRTCMAQVDSVTEDMRREEGFVEGDVRILVLSDTLTGGITTDNSIEVLAGPHAGSWQIETVGADAFGIYHELRGRKA